MPQDTTTPPTPSDAPPSADPAGDEGRAQGGSAPETPAETTDAIYDRAFDELLNPDSPQAPDRGDGGKTGGDGGAEQQQSDDAEPAGETPRLSDEQTQLLRRNHLTPEMIAGWSPEQREAFLSNASKREADQQREFNRLREEAKTAQRPENREGEEDTDEDEDGKPPRNLAEHVRSVVDELEDTFGPEIKPLGDLMGRVNEQLQAAEQQAAGVPVMQQMLAEMSIENGIRDLAGEFPSLEQADARQQVIDRFHRDWRESPHRNGEGRMLDRVRAAIRDAAEDELPNRERTAARVAPQDQTRQRLKGQPPTGAGKGRKRPMTQEDVYDQAWEEHLKPEFTG